MNSSHFLSPDCTWPGICCSSVTIIPSHPLPNLAMRPYCNMEVYTWPWWEWHLSAQTERKWGCVTQETEWSSRYYLDLQASVINQWLNLHFPLCLLLRIYWLIFLVYSEKHLASAYCPYPYQTLKSYTAGASYIYEDLSVPRAACKSCVTPICILFTGHWLCLGIDQLQSPWWVVLKPWPQVPMWEMVGFVLPHFLTCNLSLWFLTDLMVSPFIVDSSCQCGCVALQVHDNPKWHLDT